MKPINPPTLKTLGNVSARFIDKLCNQGKTIFTLDEAVLVYSESRQQTSKFIRQLVERGIVARFKSGVYIILKMGQENAQLTNWPIIARELASKNQYFISHYSAMRLLGMTTHPLLDVYITVTKRLRTKIINGITYHFIYSKKEHFWGTQSYWASKQEKVSVSDIERTILDGLDRPELCGGIKDLVRGIWTLRTTIDWDRLIQYAMDFRTKAAVKRLGFILETLAIATEYMPMLSNIITQSKDYVLLDPTGIKEGKRLKRWFIQINMNVDELRESVWG